MAGSWSNLPDRRTSALDVGCGRGVLVARLADRFDSATGIDPDAAMVAAAEPRLAGRRRGPSRVALDTDGHTTWSRWSPRSTTSLSSRRCGTSPASSPQAAGCSSWDWPGRVAVGLRVRRRLAAPRPGRRFRQAPAAPAGPKPADRADPGPRGDLRRDPGGRASACCPGARCANGSSTATRSAGSAELGDGDHLVAIHDHLRGELAQLRALVEKKRSKAATARPLAPAMRSAP